MDDQAADAPAAPRKNLGRQSDEPARHRPLLKRLKMRLDALRVVPPLAGTLRDGTEISHFLPDDRLTPSVRNDLARPGQRAVKRALDIVGASILLVLLSPVFAFAAWRIYREDGTPVLYVQERIGRNGKAFGLLKFRTMRKDAEEVLARWREKNVQLFASYLANNFKLRSDPRITSTGKWLRRTSLDELPQLWNVLRSEMSLVGPRPLLEREIREYGDNFKLYVQVRPGITGLWQVSGRSRTTFAERTNFDAWYVKNWSLWSDIVILLKTPAAVFKGEGTY